MRSKKESRKTKNKKKKKKLKTVQKRLKITMQRNNSLIQQKLRQKKDLIIKKLTL
jgi:hypothetical protein